MVRKGGQPDGKPHYTCRHASISGRGSKADARGTTSLAPPAMGDHLSSSEDATQSRGHCQDSWRVALDRPPRDCGLQSSRGRCHDTPGKGGRRHHYLTLEQEQILLQPFLVRAARGEMATAVEIKRALEARIGHEVNKSTLYRLLDRHGWQQIGTEASLAQAKVGKPVEGDMGPVRQESRSAQGDAVGGRKGREQQAPLNAPRKLSSQCYRSRP